ncbi:Hypothetical predicted protein, partial [Pelobates cultripes]
MLVAFTFLALPLPSQATCRHNYKIHFKFTYQYVTAKSCLDQTSFKVTRYRE